MITFKDSVMRGHGTRSRMPLRDQYHSMSSRIRARTKAAALGMVLAVMRAMITRAAAAAPRSGPRRRVMAADRTNPTATARMPARIPAWGASSRAKNGSVYCSRIARTQSSLRLRMAAFFLPTPLHAACLGAPKPKFVRWAETLLLTLLIRDYL